MLDKNYETRSKAYNTAMKEMFKKIPTMITKPLSQKQKVQKFMTEIGGVWYMGKYLRHCHHLGD